VFVIVVLLLIVGGLAILAVQTAADMECARDAHALGLQHVFVDRACYFELRPGYLVERGAYLELIGAK
jgi:hypothetical protein